MRRLTETAGMQETWSRSAVSSLHPSVVMLVTDFDGTLARIAPDPAQASILPDSHHALERLVGLLRRVAVLSSRPTTDLESLVPLEGADLIGDSGLMHLSAEDRGRLDRFNAGAARLLNGLQGVWLEAKPGATAVHYRHSTLTLDELASKLGPLLSSTGLHAQPGRRVIEVMPGVRPKGDALARLIEHWRPRGVICIGDDENDRPMFELIGGMREPHLTVGVDSEEAPADLFEGCDMVLSNPEEVSRFLALLADWASTGQS